MKILMATVAALALSATPAMAQDGVGAIGIGGNYGGAWTNTGDVAYLDGSSSTNLTVNLDRTLSGSSVSGIAGSIDVGNLNDVGTSYALAGGIGVAGTSINANVDVLGNGYLTSTSYNGGLYGGLTNDNAQLRMDFANAGQSSFSSDLAVRFDTSLDADFTALSWNVNGSGTGFGGFGAAAFDF